MRKRPKILTIPDPHAHPEYDNLRFRALGKLILKEKPDYVICIGDFGDMPSLSSYDQGKKTFEGRRYRKDKEAVWDALRELHAPVNEYNERQRKNKEKQYKPRWIMLLGNHEDRIDRYINDHPESDMCIEDLRFAEFGWEVHPFGEIVVIEGIAFSHYFASGVKGAPISGVNIGRSLIQKNLMSSVQGHSHIFDHAELSRADGTKCFGMSIGCFSHPDQIEGWNMKQHHMWWHGVVFIDDCDGEGYYDQIRPITTRKLMRDYG